MDVASRSVTAGRPTVRIGRSQKRRSQIPRDRGKKKKNWKIHSPTLPLYQAVLWIPFRKIRIFRRIISMKSCSKIVRIFLVKINKDLMERLGRYP